MKTLSKEWIFGFGLGAFLSSFVTSVAFFTVAHPSIPSGSDKGEIVFQDRGI